MWVDSAVLTFGRSLPVYPDERTFSESVGMSQKCHERKWRILLPNEKAARRRLSHSILMMADQATINAGFDFRR
jgi:hypothetical protein